MKPDHYTTFAPSPLTTRVTAPAVIPTERTFADQVDFTTVTRPERKVLALQMLRAVGAIHDLGYDLQLMRNFDALKDLQAENAEPPAGRREGAVNFPKLFPLFDTTWCDINENTGLWIAVRQGDRIVASVATRLRWVETSLADKMASTRFFTDRPAPGARCEVTARSATIIRGAVACAGALWIHRDAQQGAAREALSVHLPRLIHMLSIGVLGADHVIALVRPSLVANYAVDRYLFPVVEPKVLYRHDDFEPRPDPNLWLCHFDRPFYKTEILGLKEQHFAAH